MAPRSSERVREVPRVVMGVLVLLLALAVAALTASSASADPYVALGDSVGAGDGASAPQYRYVNRLYANYQPMLGADRLLNRSQPGATSTSLKNEGQLATALADINAASDTKAVTIDIGGNDYLNGQCTTNWDDPSTCPYRANLASILSQLKAGLAADPGDERFAVMAYYNPGVGLSSEAEFDLAELGANLAIGLADTGADVGLNDVIYQEAAKLSIPVADPSPAFKMNGQAFMADTVHPNDAGHGAIAAAFCAADPPLACTVEPPPPPPPPVDNEPPQTMITKHPPSQTDKPSVRFKFRADEPGASFQCKLDKKPWKPCSSPKKVKHLDHGKHKFQVRAIDAAGNIDPTPARDKFTVVKRKVQRRTP